MAAQSYRDTSLFITRGLTGPEGAKASSPESRGITGEEPPIETAAGGGIGVADYCRAQSMPESALEMTRAVALGRLARCLERAGQVDEAEEVRRRQADLHRKFGSVLFPAEYYRKDRERRALLQIGDSDPVIDCVKAIEPVSEEPESEQPASDLTDCPTCQRPVALTNTCNISVELAYCSRAASEEGPIANCIQYRSLGPGEATVILAEPGVMANPIVSFRSSDERESWLRQIDNNQ